MRCIFCKQDSSKSKSDEHIIPESIGNKRRVLPVGVVCDQCNNYFASKVEEPILSHPSMRNLRAWNGVRSKRGNYPSLLGSVIDRDIPIEMFRNDEGEINCHFIEESHIWRRKRELDRVRIQSLDSLHG